jgi:O-antigen/teichoic acid export membrane protein
LIILPAGIGLCFLAEPIVLLILGNKWSQTVPLIQLLAINGVLTVFLSAAHHLNLAVGMSRSTSRVLASHATITIPLMLLLVPVFGSYGAVAAIYNSIDRYGAPKYRLAGKSDPIWSP